MHFSSQGSDIVPPATSNVLLLNGSATPADSAYEDEVAPHVQPSLDSLVRYHGIRKVFGVITAEFNAPPAFSLRMPSGARLPGSQRHLQIP